MTIESKQRIATLLTHDDSDTRRMAAEDLSETDNLATISALTAALQDDNKGVRDAASRSLVSIGGISVARGIAHYIAHEDIVTRNLAAKLLMKLGDATIPALLPFLRDPNHDVRKFAVDIFGEIRSEEPIYYLLPLLKDADANVLLSTVEALGNIGSPEALDPLCKVYETYPFARASTVEALGKIAESGSSDFVLGKLRECIGDSECDAVLLYALLEALGAVGTREALHVLFLHLDEVRGKLRSVVLHAIVQIAERCHEEVRFPESSRLLLLDALRDDTEAIRLSGAKALAQFKDEESTCAMLDALGSSEELDFLLLSEMFGRDAAFERAVELLEQGGGRGKQQLILFLGKTVDDFVRASEGYSTPEVVSSVVARAFRIVSMEWHESDQETRSIIVESLFRLDGDRAVEIMGQIITEPDPWLRVQIIELLSAVRDERALDVVSRLLDDENELVREAAVSALQAKGVALGAAPMNDLTW